MKDIATTHATHDDTQTPRNGQHTLGVEHVSSFMPAAPQTTSPVPWLTSLHATPGRGDYGKASYPGNCSGLLIRDLLMFFSAGTSP